MFKALNFLIVILLLALPGPVSAAINPSQERASYEANQRGVRVMEQGRFKEAVDEFEEAYNLNRDSKIIRQNLAVACNNYAVSLMQDERFLEAREYLEKAVKANPDDKTSRENLSTVYSKMQKKAATADTVNVPIASFETDQAMGKIASDLLLQGIQYFEKKEYDLAKQVLLDSLQVSKENPTAYEILGDIAYMEQDLKKAKGYYTNAYRLRRSKNLEEKIEKVGREAPVEEKLDSYSDEHFIIRYKEDIPKPFGSGFEIREFLRQAYTAISQDFGYYPHEKVVVLLYNEEEYRQLSNAPAWTAGHFDGKIRLPAYKGKTDARELRKLIWHELTHFFVLDLSKGKCSLWLNEGLAQYEEDKVKTIKLKYFNLAVKNNSLLSIEELNGGLENEQDVSTVYLFYQQSFVITKSLVEKYHMFKIKQMLAEFAKGRNLDQAFKDILGISRQAFEIKWLASLSGNPPPKKN